LNFHSKFPIFENQGDMLFYKKYSIKLKIGNELMCWKQANLLENGRLDQYTKTMYATLHYLFDDILEKLNND